MKKVLALLLTVIIAASVFTALPFTVSAAENSVINEVGASSGTTGDCTWSLDDNGTLTISGNGAMDDEFNGGPWGNSVKTVIIKQGVTNIGNSVFRNSYFLENVSIPDSVNSIGNYAFMGCPSIKSITIPAGVSKIGESAFSMCDSLADISVDVNNKVFDSRDSCNAIIETKTNKLISGCKGTKIPNSIKSIGEYSFSYALTLFNIDIPGNVTNIEERAFEQCANLKTVLIASGVTGIGDYAFSQCFSLEKITIPQTVTNIGNGVFESCDNLTIYGVKGSASESYASEYIIQFKELGQESQNITGDANGDNTVDVLDAAAVQKHAAGISMLDSAKLAAADVNGDGNVDVLDAADIQKFAAGKITEFKKK